MDLEASQKMTDYPTAKNKCISLGQMKNVCSVHPGKLTCSKVAVLVDFENDVIPKIEHNVPKQTFSSLRIMRFHREST